ncbi:hypothetical protein K2173_002900 [Erythroxylum novogranatense]|uniref:GPI-anchored wall transfer protein n=1 Tax=Erythroxylum novogranatense TaxID=1862640 RepID=A0AAV8SR49_9ROSI|nr:hypothetical protein K2173_002900 [Erythroxylum novogranatense]
MNSLTHFNSLNPNKHLKEKFVSNLSGSSMLEIAALSLIPPLLLVLRHAICSSDQTGNLSSNGKRVSTKKDDDATAVSKKLGAYLTTMTVDFLSIILPILLFFTVLSQWTFVSAILLSLVVFTVAAKRFTSSTSYAGGSLSLRTNISSYRVLVMLVTCLCILAVDFRIFPRRFAKTETFGTGLMDLGVGSFIVANALVSRNARGVSSMSWKNAIQSTSPLLLLGFGRLFSTRSVDYQVHIGEYGVHWNFFFTLASVAILTTIINIRPRYSGIVGLAILSGYQFWLSHGLNAYLLSEERGTDILSKNKEGIFSILGYWGMYLVGVQLGNFLFFGNNSSTTVGSNKWARIRILVLSVIFWSITILLDRHVERVSRRMCNLAYVTLVLAQNLQVLAVVMLSDYMVGSKVSVLEEALNRNLLAAFLLANILTGLVNLSMDTLSASSFLALVVLLLYAYLLSILTGLADFYGVRLKFW